jgi:ATP-dependent 26S proteasome regulatory subunit
MNLHALIATKLSAIVRVMSIMIALIVVQGSDSMIKILVGTLGVQEIIGENQNPKTKESKTMNNFSNDITDYICSGHAMLHVETFEKDRAISEIAEAASKVDRKIHVWSIATGWLDANGKTVGGTKPSAPLDEQLQAVMSFDENVVCIFRDFGVYLKHATYANHDIVIAWLDELRKIIASVGQTLIFVGPDFTSPKALLHDITRIDFDLPDNEQIEERINYVCDGIVKPDGEKFELDKKIVPKIIDACRGMTSQQTADRVALALRKHKDLNEWAVETIVKEKASVIRASGLLTYIESPKGVLDNVGGYDAIKEHVRLDQPCFTQEARDFGIEFPRGLMLVGIPGCGKTLLSLAIASELKLPLISMDVGNLMDKYVGESEGNMREAIRMLESMAPCVLVLDEIEKGFGGAGDTDGGASRRVFGTFIKWLNDRQSPVYAVATANQVQSLPPEFCRKGRFDEIYGLDLPNKQERQEIFCIHLAKRDREPGNFNLEALAKASDGYTGADIEQIVKLGLKIAFSEGGSLSQEHLEKAVPQIVPLSQTESDRIDATRKWCERHAKPANPQPKIENAKTNRRKVSLS